MKEANITRLSIILVVAIFLMQVFLVYRLYQSNINLLQREINLLIEEIYQSDLNRRMLLDGENSLNIRYHGENIPENFDSTKVIRRTNVKDLPHDRQNIVKAVNLFIEEYISITQPINLHQFDSIAGNILHNNDIDLFFYSEIVDIKSHKILETSHSPTEHFSHIIASKDIPLNVEQNRVLRLVLVNPMTRIYSEMLFMLILSVIFCMICIYSFHFHRKTLAKQRQIVQLKNDLFADISHEFKRPLSTLMQIINSFENEKIVTNEERRNRYLKIATEEIQKMSSQTEVILSMAMEDEGVLELNRTVYDIEEQAKEVAEKFMETSNKPLDIEFVSKLRNPLIFGDKHHIEHMFTNLISNAIKYSKTPIEIIIKVEKDNNWLYISVKDNGIGISEEDQLQIFDRYSRAGDTSVIKGHGIGLNYVKKMIEKHDGEISVRSELDKGSEFIIKIPVSKKYRN